DRARRRSRRTEGSGSGGDGLVASRRVGRTLLLRGRRRCHNGRGPRNTGDGELAHVRLRGFRGAFRAARFPAAPLPRHLGAGDLPQNRRSRDGGGACQRRSRRRRDRRSGGRCPGGRAHHRILPVEGILRLDDAARGRCEDGV
ncbi:MAG: hypothetical protein AVDCRST_MAG05-4268, partial [uncultured Rubrobacteraceae bacterium]